ncbi:MAG: hypothetical protein KatS3mg051_2119 [Anaerolineae bacterium]|nr:MAG: hypothetical protein KatS3mg051_2119 [Anaerolineae bacterium]
MKDIWTRTWETMAGTPLPKEWHGHPVDYSVKTGSRGALAMVIAGPVWVAAIGGSREGVISAVLAKARQRGLGSE